VPVVETEGLTKYYGRTKGIEDLSLSIEEGEIFGYLGPNGAGKTTTIRLLLNLIFPTRGKAKIFGKSVVKDGVEIRSRVGYIPGEVSLYEKMTGEEIISYFAGIRGQKPLRFKELQERFDFNPKTKVGELSHGNKQKLAILLAFSFDPELYLLDEPTSGLDPLMQQEFYALLKEEKEKGKTIFFSSHILPEVEKVCDRVGILKEGNLIAVEKVGNLKGKKIRHVSVVFSDSVSPERFKLPGVDVSTSGKRQFKMVVKGDIDPLIKAISKYKVEEINISHASLEEVFLEFYA
jgi:ABC-2 type transport system ATP-binding protein